MKNQTNTQDVSKNSHGNNYKNSAYTAYGTEGTSGKVDANSSKGTADTKSPDKKSDMNKMKDKSGSSKMPAGNPTSAGHADEVGDPPVPNRAHTAM